ncbi:MAG: hypothetical protein J6V81_01300 [Bacteroidales bacterium]|nr:hypothetical protein [Bacteroidales bacterium]
MNTILTPEKYGELKTRYPRFNEPWSDEETKELEEMYSYGLAISDMAEHLGRTPNSVRMKLKAIGLYTPKPAPRPWTEEDDKHLVALYLEGRSFQDLAGIFFRSEKAVISRLVRLRAGLRPEGSPSGTVSE